MAKKTGYIAFIAALAAISAGSSRALVNVGYCQAAPAATSAAVTRQVNEWPVTQEPARRLVEPGLPNFGKLNACLWRSGQPNQRGYQKLAEMHVKTIINLREEYPQDKDQIPAGVQYFYIPIKDETAPTVEQAKEFLRIVSNPDNWPVLVHCRGGEGRAGVMCALVRHSFDGWDDKRIMKEVNNFRTAYLGFIRTRLKGSQRQFLQEWEANNKPGAYLSQLSVPQVSSM
ncbi:MAG TPA: tyrosine-protein phosphatase [Chthonomonadaceae bacterium]|nr:tyrosine-protein phosphatase [Chthonomonadaceae bacterium]